MIPANEGIESALSLLSIGGNVIHATETCYGIACDVGNLEAVARVFSVKKRPSDMPLSVLFENIEQAKEYVEWNALAESFMCDLPGPLTLILPMKQRTPIPIFVRPFKIQDSIGVRISIHPIAGELVRRFGRPISTTSANIHGAKPAYNIEDLLAQFGDSTPDPDVLLDSGPLEKLNPSRVIDCTGTSPVILRP